MSEGTITAHETKSKLYDLYGKFDSAQESSNSNKLCEVKNNELGIQLQTESYYKNKITKLCRKMEYIIENFDKLCSASSDHNCQHSCKPFIYWLYGKINEDNYNIFYIQWIYNKLQILLEKLVFENDKKYTFDRHYSRVFDMEELQNKKLLYDFFEHYDNIKIILKRENNNVEEYCQYIKYIFELHKKIQQLYNLTSFSSYRNELEKFKKKFNQDELTLLKNRCRDDHKNPLFRVDSITAYELSEKQRKVLKHTHEYNIFDDLSEYQKMIQNSELKTYSVQKCTNCCNTLNKEGTSEDNKIKSFCESFITYTLNLYNDSKINSFVRSKYITYLNYWLNMELKKENKTVKNFMQILDQHLKEGSYEHVVYNELKDKLFDMDSDLYEELHILYNLYINYNKLDDAIKERELCKEHTKQCVDFFNKGIDTYSKTNTSKFYKELVNFWIKYNKVKSKRNGCKDKEILDLPSVNLLIPYAKDKTSKKATHSCQTIKGCNINVFPQRNHLHENTLKILTAHTKYKKLDDESVDENTCTKYCEIPNPLEKNKEAFNLLLAKHATNLEKLSNILTDTSSDDRCSYLLYWTYDKMLSIFNKSTDISQYHSIINKLNDTIIKINTDLTSDKTCPYLIGRNIDEWEKEKDMHDYFKNHQKISECITEEDGKCNKYCDYLNYINDLYMNYINVCCTCYTNPTSDCTDMCPKYFKCKKEYYPPDLITKLKCTNTNPTKSADEVFADLIIDSDVIRKTNMPYLGTFTKLLSDPFNAIMLQGIASIGVFFIFFLFYKFTPLRSLMNKKKQQKNISTNNSHVEPRKKLIYNSESPPKKANNKRIRVAYHSTN
ncbi:PIR protein [Plasmodium vivax]|nr:PIR protein [Plasmodium vivax]